MSNYDDILNKVAASKVLGLAKLLLRTNVRKAEKGVKEATKLRSVAADTLKAATKDKGVKFNLGPLKADFSKKIPAYSKSQILKKTKDLDNAVNSSKDTLTLAKRQSNVATGAVAVGGGAAYYGTKKMKEKINMNDNTGMYNYAGEYEGMLEKHAGVISKLRNGVRNYGETVTGKNVDRARSNFKATLQSARDGYESYAKDTKNIQKRIKEKLKFNNKAAHKSVSKLTDQKESIRQRYLNLEDHNNNALGALKKEITRTKSTQKNTGIAGAGIIGAGIGINRYKSNKTKKQASPYETLIEKFAR